MVRILNRNFLDCCENPILVEIKSIYESTHDRETLCKCKTCGSYWFYRFHEFVTFDRPDEVTCWYSRLTPDDVDLILNSKKRPDLSFLSDRPTFMEDDEGVKRVTGQPDYPWS